LHRLVEQRTAKEWYTTADIAGILAKAEFTFGSGAGLGVSARRSDIADEGRTRPGSSPMWNCSGISEKDSCHSKEEVSLRGNEAVVLKKDSPTDFRK